MGTKKALRAVGIVIAIASVGPAATAQQGRLGSGERLSEERCLAIAQERSRLGYQIFEAEEELAGSRGQSTLVRLQQTLDRLKAEDEALKRESLPCGSAGGLTGSVTSGTAEAIPGAPPPMPPGGLSGLITGTDAPTGAAPPAGSAGAPVGPGVPWGAKVPTNAAGSSMPWGSSTWARGSDGGLTGPAAAALCKEKKEGVVSFDGQKRGGLDQLRAEAAQLRANIAATERIKAQVIASGVSNIAPDLELAKYRTKHDEVALRISNLEESMEGIAGCDPSTGTIKAPTVPSALAGTERTSGPTSKPPAPPTVVNNPPRVTPPPPTAPTPPPSAPPASTPPVTTSGAAAASTRFAGVWYPKVVTTRNEGLPLSTPTTPRETDQAPRWSIQIGVLELRPIDQARGEELALKPYGRGPLGKCYQAQYFEGTLSWANGGYLESGIRLLFSSQRRRAEANKPDHANVIACAEEAAGVWSRLKARFDGPADLPGLAGEFYFNSRNGTTGAGSFNFSVPRGGDLYVAR